MKTYTLRIALAVLAAAAPALAGDWYRWRGPMQNGVSDEKGLPEKWDPDTGENVLWKIKVGGMSSPIVMNGKLYTITRVGESPAPSTFVPGHATQEAVICVDADTGKEIWKHTENLFQTRVPFHRLGWANPAGDPATGNVYVLGVQCTMQCLDGKTGEPVWRRQLTEEFGMISTFGGRTNTPVVDEDQVIISGVCFGWGDNARGQYRLLAFDKATGRLNWNSNTGGLPVDAPFNTPAIAVINGVRVVVCAAGDGGVHAFKVRSGEKVWSFAASKRGMNASVLINDGKVFICHCEENIQGNKLGSVICVDAAAVTAGKPKELWRIDGIEAGFASPTLIGGTLYVLGNAAGLYAIDAASGKELWRRPMKLGTIAKASLVAADGRLYVAEANGRFQIVQPGPRGGEVLYRVDLQEKLAREYVIYGSVAISNGRIYLQAANTMYCIGPKQAVKTPTPVQTLPPENPAGEPAFLQVVPADVTLRPGQKATFSVRVFDASGNLLKDKTPTAPEWSVGPVTITAPKAEPVKAGNLNGTVDKDGTFTAVGGPPQGGAVFAKVGNLTGFARVRVLPALPWKFDFEAAPEIKPPLTFINSGGKYEVRKLDGGGKGLVKFCRLPNDKTKLDPRYNPLYDTAWTYFGPPDMTNYTIEADMQAMGGVLADGQLQMADGGIVNSRYLLVLMGNHQRLSLNVWQPTLPYSLNTTIDFKWEPNKWYRLKLMVQQETGKAAVRGKVWPVGENEPAAWTVELSDPRPNTSGSPGLYAFSNRANEVYFDNILVEAGKAAQAAKP